MTADVKFCVLVLRKMPLVVRQGIYRFSWTALEKGTATHSSVLAWRIPWTEDPCRLQYIGLQRVGYNLGSIVIFTILILATQEHGISPHLFVSPLISFIRVLLVFRIQVFVSLSRFIPRHFCFCCNDEWDCFSNLSF